MKRLIQQVLILLTASSSSLTAYPSSCEHCFTNFSSAFDSLHSQYLNTLSSITWGTLIDLFGQWAGAAVGGSLYQSGSNFWAFFATYGAYVNTSGSTVWSIYAAEQNFYTQYGHLLNIFNSCLGTCG